jgi:hypothetical protein
VAASKNALASSNVNSDARHRFGLHHALLLDQQFQGAEAAPAGRHLMPGDLPR